MNVRERPHFAFLDNGGLPIAFAHQGARDVVGDANGNTMLAFEAAISQGYSYLETDVICDADGRIVISHGSGNLDEVARSNLPLRSELETMTLKEIQAKYRFNGYPMPELAEVFNAWPNVRINIDAKTENAARYLPGVIRQANAIDRVCIASFKYARTKMVADALGGQEWVCTATGMLGGIELKIGRLSGLQYLSRTKAACLQLPLEQTVPLTGGRNVHTTKKMVKLATKLGLQVHIWTPNTEDEIKQSLDTGADGIMTNETQLLRSILIERNSWPSAA